MTEVLLKIVILEPSPIICSGVATMLKRLPGFHANTIEINTLESINRMIKIYNPDVIIINPMYYSTIDIHKFKDEVFSERKYIVALLTNYIDTELIALFDDNIGMFDSNTILQEKLNNLMDNQSEDSNDQSGILSQREKIILANVVMGKTNREVADELFISPHTVNTHRRNIARKLGIHSSAGLTIYAIINKIVDLDSINITD